MVHSVVPITDVREISSIAYGFMASKVLFASLNVGLFDHLAEGPRSLEELRSATGIAENRLVTLLTACTSLGLIALERDRYVNAPASAQYLVSASPSYFGDYFRFQIDRQVYPLMSRLDEALRGNAPSSLYDAMQDPEEAAFFTRAQHAGSLGPASVLARQVDLSGARTLLDVAGGSGAFSLTLCRRFPGLRATILDFPHVLDTAKRYIEAAGMSDRIELLAGNALEVAWPSGQDVVLQSYLLSAVSGEAIPELFARARQALRPGGRLLVHDFFVDDDRTGPRGAALWFTSFLFNPEAVSLTPRAIRNALERAGLEGIEVVEVVPGLTRMAMAKKPDRRGCA
jgi:2-hydroxy-4-(methylsulfanyl)butanoate S-methyltransferase